VDLPVPLVPHSSTNTAVRRSCILRRRSVRPKRRARRRRAARLHARRRSSSWSALAYWYSASAHATSASNCGRGSSAAPPAKVAARTTGRGRRCGNTRRPAVATALAAPPGSCSRRASTPSVSKTRAATLRLCRGLAPIRHSALASESRVYSVRRCSPSHGASPSRCSRLGSETGGAWGDSPPSPAPTAAQASQTKSTLTAARLDGDPSAIDAIDAAPNSAARTRSRLHLPLTRRGLGASVRFSWRAIFGFSHLRWWGPTSSPPARNVFRFASYLRLPASGCCARSRPAQATSGS